MGSTIVRAIRKSSKTTIPSRTFLLSFLIGAVIGLFAYRHQSVTRIDVVSADDLYYTVRRFERNNLSAADILNKVIRLHCVLLTNSKTSAKLIKISAIWATRCNSFSLYNRTKTLPYWWEAFRGTFTQHWTKADWFLFVEPSTYFVPENIRLFLLPFFNSKYEPVAFGSQTRHGVLPVIILSGESLRWIVGSDSTASCDQDSWNLQDCLSDVGIKVIETRDQFGRHSGLSSMSCSSGMSISAFSVGSWVISFIPLDVVLAELLDCMIHFRILPYPPDVLLNRDVISDDIKYVREMLDPLQIGPMCCSSTAFAVMGIRERFIKSAHYFVSMVHSTALERNYSQMSFRQKLENALEIAKEGLPPTIVWQ